MFRNNKKLGFVSVCLFIFTDVFSIDYEGARDQKYKQELFEKPGLVWVEDISGTMFLQHIYLSTDLSTNNRNPQPFPIARAEAYKSNFTHMDVDVDNRTLVLFDAKQQKITAITFSEIGLPRYWDLFEGTSPEVNGLAIDWVTDVVYWTDARYNAVLAVSMFTPNAAEVIVGEDQDEHIKEPFGIATLPRKGFLFWSDADEIQPRLMRSTLGGRQVITLIRFQGRCVRSLYVDNEEERIYWMYELESGYLRGISSCDANGQDVRSYPITLTTSYYDVGVFAGQILYIESGEVNVYQIEREITEPKFSARGFPLTLSVIEKSRNNTRTNPCMYSSCPGICTKSNYTENCFCYRHQLDTVDHDLRETYCGWKQFEGLLLPKSDGIYTLPTNFIEYKPGSRLSRPLPQKILDLSLPTTALASDLRAMKIFFYEYKTHIIKSLGTSLAARAKPVVVSFAVGNLGGLAFDSSSRNLYWTDKLLGHIMVARENGEFPFVLHRNLQRPKAIAIHPTKHLLFWSELGSGKLMKSYLDGSDKQEIDILEVREIVDIAVDFEDYRLYLCGRNSVHEVGFDGENFFTHYYDPRHNFTGISILHDYLVLTDTSYRTSGLHVFDRKSQKDSKLMNVGSRTFSNFLYGNWYGVRYHHVSNQPDPKDICQKRGAECEHLCLPGGGRRFTCACTVGFISNGTRCEIIEPYKPFLILADQRYGRLLQVHAVKEQFIAVPVKAMSQPFSVAYDPINQMVYWSDLDLGAVSRAFMNGTQQEVILFDRNAYFTGLYIEPGSRLLFYLERKIAKTLYDHDLFVRPVGSVKVYNVDTRKTLTLLDSVLQEPENLVVNVELGYIFLTEQQHVWRLNINGTNFVCLADDVQVTALTSTGRHLYFANEIRGIYNYEPPKTEIIRIEIDGGDSGDRMERKVLLQLEGSGVYAMSFDRYILYWLNGTTRGVQRTSLLKPGFIEDVGQTGALFKPTGLYVSLTDEKFESVCADSGCGGVCLPTLLGPLCEEKVAEELVMADSKGHTGLCRIPAIQYGEVVGSSRGRIVPSGYKAEVECFPAHTISHQHGITCSNGNWSSTPTCALVYGICGTPSRGYKVYTQSGEYFAYPGHTKVDVVCIGGGGGGYDVTNKEIVSAGEAGDGEDSSFGSYLYAFGGKGGSMTEGGRGGSGHVSGGSGSAHPNCSTGGTAGQAQPGSSPSLPGYSYDLFCGAGGYSYKCPRISPSDERSKETFAGPGGKDGNWSTAGRFGGGAGSRGGGTGGGGGWSRLTVTLPEKALVPVTVGQPGYPSYGQPAPGLVVVMWGDYRADDFVGYGDVTSDCVLGV